MNKTVGSSLYAKENNFDFIRFAAALAVIFSHSFALTTLIHDPLQRFSSDKESFGSIAVAIFFVISGILITQSFERSKSVAAYFRARILRIYPALIVVVLITVFILGPFLTSDSLHDYFTSHVTRKYLLNVFLVKIQFPLPGVFKHNIHTGVNGSLWTLPIELGCYCLVAVFGFAVGKLQLKANMRLLLLWLLLFALIFAELFLKGRPQLNMYYFAIGSAIYIYRDKIVLNKYAALLCLAVYLLNTYFNPGVKLAHVINGPALAYVLIFVAFMKNNSIKNFSKHGDFSYGLYILAFPIQQILVSKIPSLSPYLHFLMAAFITVIFAAVSWHLIEKQALKFKKRHSKASLDKPLVSDQVH